MSFTIEGANDGPLNMDEDIQALKRAEKGISTGRIYQWDGPWVSLGRFQKREEAVVAGSPVRSVSRPSGGAAVLHGHDLTVSLALPLELFGTDKRKLKAIYRALVTPFVTAFQSVGIKAALGEDVGAGDVRNHPYCFALHSANDVIDQDTGQKLMGCALRVTQSAVLVQASVPVSSPSIPASECLIGGEDLPIREFDRVRWINALTACLREDLDLQLDFEFIAGFKGVDRVRLALWNLWDPIGVNNQPTASDEYDSYAEMVFLSSESQTAGVLAKIRTEEMSLAENPAEDQRVADFLHDSRFASC